MIVRDGNWINTHLMSPIVLAEIDIVHGSKVKNLQTIPNWIKSMNYKRGDWDLKDLWKNLHWFTRL